MEEAKPQILLWAVPGCPHRVTITAPVINEIRILAVEAFYSVPRGGVEIGGVFFGMREPDTLHIRAYRTISCQYATGPSFTLSVKDQLGLSGLLGQAQDDPDLAGMIPLGWYHSHTRSEIFLSPADLQLYSEFFPERWQIAMVLRPANLQSTRAGFFFRDRLGGVKSDAPVREFILEPPGFGLEPIDHDIAIHPVTTTEAATPKVTVYYAAPTMEIPVAGKVTSTPALVPVPTPHPAPILFPIPTPIPELPTPAPLPNPGPPSVAVLEPPDHQRTEPAPPPLVAAAAAGAALDGTTSVETLTATVAEVPTSGISQPAPEIVPLPLPAPIQPGIRDFLAELPRRRPRNTGWIWALLGIVLLCGAGGGAVLKWGRLAKPTDLGLETYDINGAFLIRWDRESPIIRTAARATLEIQDGGEKTPIPLSPLELSVGGYGYMRRTGQVSVHMKVEGATPAEEYSNFTSAQSLGSQQTPASPADSVLAQTLAAKEHLKTELINESMQSIELRRQITELRRQLAEERAHNTSTPKR